jgi:hypothetical protein
MPLPKIEYPIFEVELPSTKQKVKYRPFLVKEEKILLMAMQGEDANEIANALKQVIGNCILDDVNVDELATIDVEYLFIKIRARSVNNIIKLTYRDLEDDKKYDVEVDLDEVIVKFSDDHTNTIRVNDKVKFTMKYPTANISLKLKNTDNAADILFDILKNCIDKVYEGKNEYSVSDSTEDELNEFITSLDVKTFNQVQKFFTTMPRLFYQVKYVNSLNKEKVITLESLNDFFTLG